MGSNNASSSNDRSVYLPSRPKYSWDVRNVPWTDGRGDQAGYSRSVKLWRKFHAQLPANNSNKIPAELQGIMLQSQLFDRAQDLVKAVPEEDIESEDGADAIVKAVYKRDPLAVVKEVYGEFMGLVNTRRGEKEGFSNFESRFQAQVAKLNSHFVDTEFPEALTAFLLLGNANIDNSQRISILAACAPTTGTFSTDNNSVEALKTVSYESVACIVRQCEKTKEVNPPKSIHSHGIFPGRKMTPAELQARKNTSKCKKCNKFGHWYKDHSPDGSLKPGVKSYDTPQIGTNPAGSTGNQKSTPNSNGKVSFNMVNLSQKSFELHNPIGPLLDDGAPYSGIGLEEFKLLQSIVYPSWNGKFDGLPDTVKHRPFWQYGVGSHSSKSRRIIGSVMLTAITGRGNEIEIRHLVIEGSSQWIIGRNVTQLCNIVRIGKNMLELPNNSGSISLKNYDLHYFALSHRLKVVKWLPCFVRLHS